LIYGLRVSIEGLRPWEYDGMSAWDYDRIVHAQNVWHEARRLLPPVKPGEQQQEPLPILPNGVGPQFA